MTEIRRILITGGSGFIGTNLVSHFKNQGHIVLSIDKNAPRNQDNIAQHAQVNILDLPLLKSTIQAFAPQSIFHLAARTDLLGNSLEDYIENSTGTSNLIVAINESTSIEDVTFASSRLVCKIGYSPSSDIDYNGDTAYGQSKAQMESIIRGSKINAPWIIVRPTSIWGPWFGEPYNVFFKLIRQGRYFHPKGRTIKKSFGFVGNTVYQLDKLSRALQHTKPGKVTYLCDYPPLEVSEWADLIRANFSAPQISSVPESILKFAALSGDALRYLGMKNPPITSFRLANLICEMIHDTEFLEEIAGPLPHSLERGVSDTIDWIKSR